MCSTPDGSWDLGTFLPLQHLGLLLPLSLSPSLFLSLIVSFGRTVGGTFCISQIGSFFGNAGSAVPTSFHEHHSTSSSSAWFKLCFRFTFLETLCDCYVCFDIIHPHFSLSLSPETQSSKTFCFLEERKKKKKCTVSGLWLQVFFFCGRELQFTSTVIVSGATNHLCSVFVS